MRALYKLALITLIALLSPSIAFGYLDPGSGSLLLSSIVALFASAIFFVKNAFYKIMSIFSGGFSARALGSTFNGGGGNDKSLAHHIVFYSEGKQYYGTFKPILDALDKLQYPYTFYTSDENDPALTRHSVLSESCGSSEKSLRSFMSNKLPCDFSHNPQASSQALECQESSPDKCLDSEISESSVQTNAPTLKANSSIADEVRGLSKNCAETSLEGCRTSNSADSREIRCETNLPNKQRCFYIGQGNKAYSFLNRLQADILVMTTPGLEVLHIRRNRGVKHYCHITHALTPLTYRTFGLDYFDSVLVANEIQKDYVRDIESAHGVKRKYIGIVGSPYLDELYTKHSVLSEACGSSEKSLRSFMSNKLPCDFSHNPQASSQALECQESSPDKCLDSGISESSSSLRGSEATEAIHNLKIKNTMDCHGDKSPRNDNNSESNVDSHTSESELQTNATTPSGNSKIFDEKLPQRVSANEAHLDVRRSEAEARRGDLSQNEVSLEKAELPKKTILISPSWGKETLLSKYGLDLLLPLAKSSFHIIIRPHPQSFISPKERENIEQLQSALQGYPNIEWDSGTPNIIAFEKADMMISDFSSVIFDFVCLHGKPVLTIDNDMDFSGYDMADIPKDSIWTFGALSRIGGRIQPSEFGNLSTICEGILDSQSSEIKAELQRTKEALWCYPHRAGEMAALELLKIEREIVEASLKPQMSLVARLRALDSMICGMSKKAMEANHA